MSNLEFLITHVVVVVVAVVVVAFKGRIGVIVNDSKTFANPSESSTNDVTIVLLISTFLIQRGL